MTRRHDIDALRALAFALLILYHLGMIYIFDWDFHVKSPYQGEWLQWPMLFVNRWRMDLVFMVSGMASAFLLKPDNVVRFLGNRIWRLFLPLVFGMLVIVPIQPYAQGVSNGLVAPGFWQFYFDYITRAHPWPANAFSGWDHSMTWNHLWYLAYLLVYTIVLALLAKPLESKVGLRLRALLTDLRGPALMILPILPFCLYTLTLQTRFPDNGDFVHDWYRNPMYFTIFLYGYIIARNQGFWTEALRLRRVSLLTALSLFALRVVLSLTLPEVVPTWLEVVALVLRNLYMWTMLLAILGWAHALLNKPFRWLPWANESVYPWYILHQSLLVGLVYVLIPFKLGPVLEPLLVLSGTVAGCYFISEGVKRINWLRPCFGLKMRPVPHHIKPEMARLGDAEA